MNSQEILDGDDPDSLEQRLSIAFDEETMRDAEVKIDDTILTAKLKDLPTMASNSIYFRQNT